MEMHQETLPGKRSTHGLSKWRCDRPESPLGQFHKLLAHFGNSGMNPEFSDILELGGATEFDVKMQRKCEQNNKKLAGERIDIPGNFTDSPRFFDHSFLHFLNELAQRKGLPIIFDDVHPMPENNVVKCFSQNISESRWNGTRAWDRTTKRLCVSVRRA
jgi:hypothetical protein